MDYYFISYGLTILAFLITLASQVFVNSSYNKYKQVKNRKGITGFDAARIMLDNNKLENIDIVEVAGTLTDHYDPQNKVVRLSQDIYRGSSIASVAVACHECGHAIQDRDGYIMLRLRHSIIPVVNFASYTGYIAIVLGLLFSFLELIWLGIIAEVIILVFQLVTLPVEFNASSRALQQIKDLNLLDTKEHSDARIVLIAAALTYVASVCSSILEILRLILLFGKRDDRY